ncbi:MAG: carboxylesterase family protein [Pseudomonadota bacterium]
MKLRLLTLALIFALAACSNKPSQPPAPVTDQLTERTIEQGSLIGFLHHDNPVHVWRSVPFARAPVGNLRWRAPRAAEGWEGMREALDHAPWCIQIRRRLDDGSSADAIPLGNVMGQEDCLYLNIYAPKMDADTANNSDLPVMMWIHGGANVWGRAEQYDPAALVAKENVIVVVVQYRLGPFGWFSNDAIEGSAEIPEDRSTNFAILDQVAALDWLKDNIGAFGGDPTNITLFGESAGGHNIAALLTSPKAKGKFHKAIVQSGLFTSVPHEEARETHPRSGNRIARKLLGEAVNAEALRSLPANEFYEAYGSKDIVTNWSPPRIIEDGIVVPIGGISNALKSRDTFNAVPIITGTNRDETKLFNILNPELVGRWLWLIPYAYDQEFYDALAEYESRMWRVSSVDKPLKAMTEAGHDAVYAYRFDWDESGSVFGSDFADVFGAAHALEIPFVMGQYRFLGRADKWVFTEENEKERLQLSSHIMGYWAEFARTGRPGTGSSGNSPQWNSWSENPGEQNIMILDSKSSNGPRFTESREKTTKIAEELFSDPRLENKEETCLTYRKTLFWNAELAGLNAGRC